jgi:hypothetical protein
MEGLTRYGAVSRDGQGEAVEGIVVALRGADASTLVKAIRARLDELAPSLPPGVKVVPFYDRSTLIQRAVGTVESALIEATVLVVVLLLLFLGELRAALVVALMVPLAALGTFLLMRIAGMSANLMSLGGLAIAIGMLVDAAVVVVENAVSRLDPHIDGAQLPRLHRVFAAAREVALPVASGILIICLTFVPLLTLQGLEGKLFAPVALTIVFALGVSLLLSLTLVPVLASLLLKAHAHREPWVMRGALRLYRPVLDAALATRCGPRPWRWRPWCWAWWPTWAPARPSCRRWTRATSCCSCRSRRPSGCTARATSTWRCRRPSGHSARSAAQHRPRRLGRTGARPDGPERNRPVHAARTAQGLAQDKEALSAEIRKVMAAFPAWNSASPSPSRCASPKCSPAAVATWPSSSSALT